MKIAADPLETLEPLPVEPREPVAVDEPVGDDSGEALIREAKQRARRRRLLYAGVAIIVAAIAGTAFSSWASNAAPPNHETPPVPAPPAVPLGAPLVVGPNAASTLLASYGQFHVGYVFVYADGRVIWEPDVGVYADADGRVTGIPLSTGELGPDTISRFWLTESGLKPGSWTPEGAFGHRQFERRLSAYGLELVREGKIDVKHLLVLPGELWPAELPRRAVDLNQWPVAIQLALRTELWASPTAKVWQPSTWAIDFHWDYPFEDVVDVTRALEQLPASAQALVTDKRRTCNYENGGNAHWQSGPILAGDVPPTECFELTAAELAAFSRSLEPNTSIADLSTGWHIEVDGRDAILNVLPIYPHDQPQVWGG